MAPQLIARMLPLLLNLNTALELEPIFKSPKLKTSLFQKRIGDFSPRLDPSPKTLQPDKINETNVSQSHIKSGFK